MQHHICDDADGPNSGLTVATSVIDLLDEGTVKQQNGEFEG
jgi:hypothetical protein